MKSNGQVNMWVKEINVIAQNNNTNAQQGLKYTYKIKMHDNIRELDKIDPIP